MTLSEILVDEITHRNGVPWHEAPKPRRLFHRHEAWTSAPTKQGYMIQRCACGALRYTDIPGWAKRGRPRFRRLVAQRVRFTRDDSVSHG